MGSSASSWAVGFLLRFLSHATPSEAFECLNHRHLKYSNNSNPRRHFPRNSPTHFPVTAHYTPHLFVTPATVMVVVDSTPRRPPAERGSIQIPTASAFNICDGLFRMANCLITELPEAELRDVRYVLDTLLTKVDRLLDPGEYDLSLNFGGLTVDAGKPGILHQHSQPLPTFSHPPHLQIFATIRMAKTSAQV